MPRSSMHFGRVVQILNEMLSREHPEAFRSSWILKRAPHCYRFIRKKVRTDLGAIDWDRLTCALEWKFQRLWIPGRRNRSCAAYRNHREVHLALEKYRSKLYVFLSPQNALDRRIRETISIALVRLAQHGNLSAKQKIMELIRYTIDDWIDRYRCFSCWRGYEAEVRTQVEGCIRRYRYSGSFLRYVFRTLEYAGRGMQLLQAYSLDEPTFNSSVRRIDRISCNPQLNVLADNRNKYPPSQLK
jgi:hypothetical protein